MGHFHWGKGPQKFLGIFFLLPPKALESPYPTTTSSKEFLQNKSVQKKKISPSLKVTQFERTRTFCLFGCLRLIRSSQICCCRRNGRRSKLTTRLQSWRTFWQENAGSSRKQSIGQTIKNSLDFVQKAHGGFSIIFVNCREGRRIWMYPGIDSCITDSLFVELF